MSRGLGPGRRLHLPLVPQPLRAARDQPHLERGRHGAGAYRRLPQRPPRDHRRPRHPVGRQAPLPGVTTSVKKREGRLKLTSSYTWSRLEGNVPNEEDNEYGEHPPARHLPVRALPSDRRHEVRASAAYQVTRWLSTGVLLQLLLGRALQPAVSTTRSPGATTTTGRGSASTRAPTSTTRATTGSCACPTSAAVQPAAAGQPAAAHRPAPRALRRHPQRAGAAYHDGGLHRRRTLLRPDQRARRHVPHPPGPALPLLGRATLEA